MGRRVKTQAVTSYVLLVSVVIAALIGMQVYFSRSLQGRHKRHTDSLVSGAQLFSPQFSRYKKINEVIGGVDPENNQAYGYVSQTETEPSGKQITRQLTNRINRVISGQIDSQAMSGQEFFSPDAPQELKREEFSDVEIRYNYFLDEGTQTGVSDNFSGNRLSEDRLFGEEND